ncbi:unnamed protein product [Heterobilharzia americana]|nr:unnamed protein product [Heterobilharzia americana]
MIEKVKEKQDDEDIGEEIYKIFKQIQPSKGWFPNDLHEFLNFYDICNFPLLKVKKEIVKEDEQISSKYLHDMVLCEIGSENIVKIIQDMENRLNDGFEEIINQIDSLNIFSIQHNR